MRTQEKTFLIAIIVLAISAGIYFFVYPSWMGGSESLDANITSTGDEQDISEEEEYIGPRVQPLVLADQTIEFPHTDDNEGETLIIKSDRKLYYSDSYRSDVYISITNTSNIDQSTALLFYFPGNQKAEPATLELYKNGLPAQAGKWEFVTFYKNNIKINQGLLDIAIKKRESIPDGTIPKAGAQISVSAGQTIYLKTIITYEPNTEGEFWIEALGDSGSYGLLDPYYGLFYVRAGGSGSKLIKIRGGVVF